MKTHASWLLGLTLAVGPASGQTLVSDVDATPASTYVHNARNFTVMGGALYALGDVDERGALITVGSSGTPAFLRGIPTPGFGAASGMAASTNRVFFAAQGGLWTSDSTAALTGMVRRLGAGGRMAAAGGVAFFGVGAPTGIELWTSDGTAAGTARVATGVTPNELTAAGNRVFFVNGSQPGLWTSDGTGPGTRRVGTVELGNSLSRAVVQNGILYFIGRLSGQGGLWRTDGTDAGTVEVVNHGTSQPSALAPFGSGILMGAPGGLWFSDGTTAGTVLVRGGVLVRTMVAAGGTAFFHGSTPEWGEEVWRSDGTPNGTQVVDVCPGTCSSLRSFFETYWAALPGGAVFTQPATRELWRTDGTTAGTLRLATFNASGLGSSIRELSSFLNWVYFAVEDGGPGDRTQMWRTDGSVAGTAPVLLGATTASSLPKFQGSAGPRAVFDARSAGTGPEPWVTDGTPSGTAVLDLTPGAVGTDWQPLASLGSTFTFFAGNSTLMATDGTVPGTRALGSSFELNGIAAATREGVALFTGRQLDIVSARVCRTDGTTEGTRCLQRPPGEEQSNPQVFPREGAIVAGPTRFVAVMGDRPQIWLTDGGAEPPLVVNLPTPCAWSAPDGARLFLACGDTNPPRQLWTSDGSHSGTRLVATLPNALLDGWRVLEGRLFFRVATATGSELWTSDGTTPGTVPMSSIAPVPADPFAMTVSAGLLFFAGTTDDIGTELWRTDGTAAGTFALTDIDFGPSSSLALDLETADRIVAVDDGVVFVANARLAGEELWRSDGTVAGTGALPEVAAGRRSSTPSSLLRVGSRLFFAAADTTHGREPWVMDLPSVVAVRASDASVPEGDGGATVVAMAVRLSAPSNAPVTVAYTTASETATAGSDFVSASGTLTFAPGVTERTVAVSVLGDLADEGDEAFALRITSATGASIADARGTAVVVDDDRPRVAVAEARTVEGTGSPTDVPFPVTLTTKDGLAATHAVEVRGIVWPGTAGIEDFVTGPVPLPQASVTFPAGSPSGAVAPLVVQLWGDALDEPNENYAVQLLGQNDAEVTPGTGAGTILDDDGVAAGPPIELGPGTTVRADLAPPPGGGADLDFYVLRQAPVASYELVADEVGGDVAPLVVERVAADGAVLQSGTLVGAGSAISMRWFAGDSSQHLRVRGACAASCGSDDVYRLRLYETTLAGPRVNDDDGNATVLILQNTTAAPVASGVSRWAPDGTSPAVSGGFSFTIEPHGTVALPMRPFPEVPFKGSITVSSDAPYGGLVGKLVTYDPSSGFAFDTPLVPRKH